MINTHELKNFLVKLNEQEKAWVFGYLDATLTGGNSQNLELPSNISAKFGKIGILFVTETGNAKTIANDLSAYLKKQFPQNLQVKVYDSRVFKPAQIEKEECLFIVASTHGDGEIPESGKKFYEFLTTTEAKFSSLSFAVLALGDTSYPFYCKSGVDISEALEKLDAKKLLEPKLIDVDLNGVHEWFSEVEAKISEGHTQKTAQNIQNIQAKTKFEATILENICLSDVGSNKEVHHIAFEMEEGVSYECGDALSITPIFEGQEKVAPRLYSIASSPSYHQGEVHILISVVKNGLCSNYLKSLPEGAKIEAKISKNNMFRLPQNEKDIIMVGPGTGLAPFRSFLFERQEGGASGKNWLFFGEQKSTTDFYYQLEMQELLASGGLTKLSLAFSRDTNQKVYVQHRMRENGKELFQWLKNGAVFYVCGAKDPMSIDVETTLLEIIAEHSTKGMEFAKEYLDTMISEDRYRKDVY